MAERIILDVDTGYDDMVAIVMAAGLPEIDLVGVVAVAGNQTLERTLENTLNVCDLIGVNAPVFAGMDHPILRQQITAGNIHGETGLDGPVFPPRKKQAESGHGVGFIIDEVRANPGAVTLVPTGPLTDIAMAVRLEPRLPSLVKRIVLMGGSMGKGNVTLDAEFNMYADPEAASIVLASGAPIVMMGLDVTLQVVLDETHGSRYHALATDTATMFNASMERYRDMCRRHGQEYPAMHDPCCVAYVADPSLFTLQRRMVTVELRDPVAYGRTIAQPASDKGNIQVGIGADTSRFWRLLDKAFANLP